MRQAGYMAATGIYALENNIKRLETGSSACIQIADALQEKEFTDSDLACGNQYHYFQCKAAILQREIVEKLKNGKYLVFAISATQIRMVHSPGHYTRNGRIGTMRLLINMRVGRSEGKSCSTNWYFFVRDSCQDRFGLRWNEELYNFFKECHMILFFYRRID